MQQMQQQLQQQAGLQPANSWSLPPPGARRNALGGGRGRGGRAQASRNRKLAALGLDPLGGKKSKKDKKVKKKRGSKLEFKRVDQLWDSTIHNYKLTDTAEDEESSEYDQYLFNVRRTFDWEGKYKVRIVFRCEYSLLTTPDYGRRYQEQAAERSTERGNGWRQGSKPGGRNSNCRP